MQLLSRLSFLCNISFLLMLCLRFLRIRHSVGAVSPDILDYQPLVGTLIVLGYCAFFINILLMLMLLVYFMLRKPLSLPRWLLLTNLFLFLVQLYYFFVGNT